MVRSNIEFAILQGWLLFVSGKHDEALRHLQEIEQAFGLDQVATETGEPRTLPSQSFNRAAISGRIAAIRASIALSRGDLPRAIVLSHQALEALPEESMARSYVAGYLGKAYYYGGEIGAASQALEEACRVSWEVNHVYGLFLVLYDLAHLHIRQGHLSQADQICRQALKRARDQGRNQPAQGSALVVRGSLAREWNDLDTAASLLREGIQFCEQTANTRVIVQALIELAFLKQAQGDPAGASALMQQAVQRAEWQHRSLSRGTQEVEAYQAWLFLMQGDQAAASHWVQHCTLNLDQELNHLREREYLTLVRILIAQHKLDAAAQWLAKLLQLAEAQGRTGSTIEILMLQAETLQASGKRDQAMGQLARALSLAEPEGYIRLFVDEGSPLARLLAQMRRRLSDGQSGSTDYRENLLELLGRTYEEDRSQEAFAGPEPGTSLLDEALSERELVVLRLIVAGCSNREIADRLVIAVSTVKWYVNAIYGKLQVESRTKAIARARELNIVE
jgi:LuxR family maltose regulon positive regulatory protein